MDLLQVMKDRHAVRHYDGKPLKPEHIRVLKKLIKKINEEQNLHIQLVVNEPKAFDGGKAAMCNFTGCVNYLAFIGPKTKDLGEKIGYFGEQIILKCQELGINSCWVYLTFNKQENVYQINEGEVLACVASLGYGTTQGKPHESKSFEDVVKTRGTFPTWFMKGVEAALLAPTGRNAQGFKLWLLGDNQVKIKNRSLCKRLDLGIVKYHFEMGAGRENFTWKK